jgi:hypothetical protein
MGRRTVSAGMLLERGVAAPALPLRVAVEEQGGRRLLRIRNATVTRVGAFTGEGDPAALARILDTLRRRSVSRSFARGTYIPIRGRTASETLSVAAPLLVSGTVGQASVRISCWETGGRSSVWCHSAPDPAWSSPSGRSSPRLCSGHPAGGRGGKPCGETASAVVLCKAARSRPP